MRLDVDGLRSRQPDAIQALMGACERAAKVSATKVGAGEFVQDITQDMAMMVLTRFLEVYDREREIEPFLHEMARRMGLSYYRRHSREVNASGVSEEYDILDHVAGDELDGEAERIEDEAEREARQAREILIQRIRAKAADSKAEPPITAPPSPATKKASRTSGAYRNSPRRLVRAKRREVQELVAIRKRIGLTQSQMAAALNLPSIRAIRSIEYGVVHGDLDVLLPAARALEAELRNTDDGDSILSNSGSELVRRWSRALGVAEGDVSGLAQHIGVNRVTVYRWSLDKTRPPAHLVAAINTMVEVICSER